MSNLPLFGVRSRKGDWLSERQKALVKSIARPAAPHYQASDPRPLVFKSVPASIGRRPQPAQIDSPQSAAAGLVFQRDGTGDEASPTIGTRRPAESAPDDHLKSSLYRKPGGRSL
ncbi:MAG TPA: hypothetical protein VKS60_10120 [Stellaceae bacterium]|nr:hypothetical protein [Stellaceae bacterium]